MASDDVLEAALRDVGESEVAFSVDLDGYEGPLHVLLRLARDQKVDLRRLSILKLAEQYLEFVTAARSARIDLAADYLVMASWLAYLKSKLLLPEPPNDGRGIRSDQSVRRVRGRGGGGPGR
jgi:segregation and condensation protein A